MKFQLTKLKNNLNTLFVDFPGTTAGSVQIWFRAGSALEDESHHGVAHFLEHMFFKGTPKRPGAKIAHEAESFGGEINAFTSFDYTCYYINCPKDHLKKSADIILDMVSNPSFLEEELTPEKEVVFEEFRRSQDNPNQKSFQILQKNCFKGSYSHPILGSGEKIKAFNRDQIINFRKEFYNNSNALFVVSGDLGNKEELTKLIETYNLPSGPESQFPKFQLQKIPQLNIHNHPVKMGQLTMVIEAPPIQEKEATAEDLAINCLGHGESSPLYEELVTKTTLANGVSSSSLFMADGGTHFIKIGLPPKNLKKTLNIFSNTILNLLENGIKEEEIQKIKNQYVASKLYEKETLESFAFSLGHSFAQSGDIYFDENFIERIKMTKAIEVNKKLRSIFQRPIHMVFQIPNDLKGTQFEKDLKKFQKDLLTKAKKILKPKKSLNAKTSAIDPNLKLVKIKPGVSLLYRKNPIIPTFSFHCYIKGGLTEESLKSNGSYHLLSSLLTKGYGKTNEKKLTKDLEEKSANLMGFSGKNAYGMTLHGQSVHYDELIKHFFGGLLDPIFPAKGLSHEKKMVLRQLENQKEDPIQQCFIGLNNMMFPKHPYSYNMLGSKGSVKELTQDKLKRIHKKNINSKEILFTYCGDFEIEEVLESILPYFEQLKGRKSKSQTSAKILSAKKEETLHIPFDREQTQIFLGIPTYGFMSKEGPVLKMLTTHLSGQSSELFYQVREKQGLCYSVQPVNFSALEGGYWGIYMASGNDKAHKAMDAIKTILANIKQNGIGKEDFLRIKKMIEGQENLNIQTNEDYANIHSVPILHGKPLDYYFQRSKMIKDLDYEVFQDSLKKILQRNFKIVTVGKDLESN